MRKFLYKVSHLLKSNKLFRFDKSTISKSAAAEIQRETYNHRHNCKRNIHEKPYMSIVSFLDSPENEIFYTAVYNLVNIAKNSVADRKHIKEILQKKAEEKSLPEEQKKYLAEHLREI